MRSQAAPSGGTGAAASALAWPPRPRRPARLDMRRSGPFLPTLLAGLAAVVLSGNPAAAAPAQACQSIPLPAAARAATASALASGPDIWGERLLSTPGGPRLEAARALLPPLFYAWASGGVPLTSSGVYYLPFGEPAGPLGTGAVDLHLADGSQIVVASAVGDRSLTLRVGAHGAERYGSCLARLAGPALAGGYLPILETGYRDAEGGRYRQESFAATVPALHRVL